MRILHMCIIFMNLGALLVGQLWGGFLLYYSCFVLLDFTFFDKWYGATVFRTALAKRWQRKYGHGVFKSRGLFSCQNGI